VCRWYLKAPATAEVLPLPNRLWWWLVTPVVVLALAAFYSWWLNAPFTTYQSVREFIVMGIVSSITLSFAALVCFALWYSWRYSAQEIRYSSYRRSRA
jgi:uncharacterized membrane protein (DUF485 family)